MSSAASDIPAALRDVPTLERTKATVARLARPEAASTAVLLYGPEGSGSEELADFLVRAWVCAAQTGIPCGECPACRGASNGRCVDLQKVAPYGNGRNITVHAIRETPPPNPGFEGVPLIDFFRTRPLLAKRKVVWFAQAERMTSAAANSLLKAVEEIHDYARVVFTTTNVSLVLPTIRSRCVMVPCGMAELATDDPLVRAFCSTKGDAARVQAHRQTYERLEALLAEAVSASPMAAFALAERFRGLVDAHIKATGLPARTAATNLIDAAARWLAVTHPDRVTWIQGAARAHRRIQGNVSTPYAVDCWFLAGTRDEPEQDQR